MTIDELASTLKARLRTIGDVAVLDQGEESIPSAPGRMISVIYLRVHTNDEDAGDMPYTVVRLELKEIGAMTEAGGLIV